MATFDRTLSMVLGRSSFGNGPCAFSISEIVVVSVVEVLGLIVEEVLMVAGSLVVAVVSLPKRLVRYSPFDRKFVFSVRRRCLGRDGSIPFLLFDIVGDLERVPMLKVLFLLLLTNVRMKRSVAITHEDIKT